MNMRPNALIALLFALPLLAAPYHAHAAKKAKNEVYAATEGTPNDEEETQENSEDSVPQDVASPEITTETTKKTEVKTKTTRFKTQASKEQQDDTRVEDNYDPVPSDQAKSIARRLSIVRELLIKHGRAYDYRSMTTKQLLEIRERLNRG
jgi:hypothetical protein